MTLTPEQERAIAEQTDYPVAWKREEGPNPIVGEYLEDAEAEGKHGLRRIRIIRHSSGQRYAVWLLGQLDVQWDELETKPVPGDILSFWVSSKTVVSKRTQKEYRPSKIVHVRKDALPSPVGDADTGSVDRSGPGQAATDADRAGEGSAVPAIPVWMDFEGTLRALGQWPPSEPLKLWMRTHDRSQIEQALDAKMRAKMAEGV